MAKKPAKTEIDDLFDAPEVADAAEETTEEVESEDEIEEDAPEADEEVEESEDTEDAVEDDEPAEEEAPETPEDDLSELFEKEEAPIVKKPAKKPAKPKVEVEEEPVEETPEEEVPEPVESEETEETEETEEAPEETEEVAADEPEEPVVEEPKPKVKRNISKEQREKMAANLEKARAARGTVDPQAKTLILKKLLVAVKEAGFGVVNVSSGQYMKVFTKLVNKKTAEVTLKDKIAVIRWHSGEYKVYAFNPTDPDSYQGWNKEIGSSTKPNGTIKNLQILAKKGVSIKPGRKPAAAAE